MRRFCTFGALRELFVFYAFSYYAYLVVGEGVTVKLNAVGERSAVKISVVGEGVEWKLAYSPTAPNEQNRVLHWLITGQIQVTSRYVFSKNMLNRP